MPAPNKRTGKVYIKIDGVLYESNMGAKLTNPMGVSRPANVGTDVFGYNEKAEVPQVDAEFSHGSGLSLAALASITDATLQFNCDSGPQFILRNAWYSSGMTLTGGQGWVAVTFLAKKCEEQGVSS